uniref:EF-hand domain-containing protein n=1 Tax=Arcella intermedia TaxID=1963864 RepID=A0A6B2LPU5_9EUKA
MNVYKEAFGVFDKKGQGEIGSDALKKLLKSLGEDVLDDEVKAIINLDGSSPDAISFEAFVKLMAARMDESEQEEELKAVFDALDPDDSGLISISQLKVTLESVLNESLDDMEDLIGETKHKNKLDFSEFKKLMGLN